MGLMVSKDIAVKRDVVQTVATAAEIRADLYNLAREADAHRAMGRKVVIVQGLGFVGTAVAAVVAGARDAAGEARHFVIGVDVATEVGCEKVRKINAGVSPIVCADQSLAELIADGALMEGNLRATVSDEVYSLGDVIVVDVPFEVLDRLAENPEELEVDLESFQQAIRAIGRRMRPDALVMIETTVPVGACRHAVLPILLEERARRDIRTKPFLAHSYERVMPGPNYVDSIRQYWRVFAGIDDESAELAREFLESFIDTSSFELRRMEDTAASEMAKLLENSYRAANIAFINEWTLLAEQTGVNLFDVIEAIRLRKGTHDNIRTPGFGVGGYCLTKDSLLAQWGASRLLDSDVLLSVSLEALRINNRMPLHTLSLLKKLFDGGLNNRTVAVCGVSYLPGVADTRNSPAESFAQALLDCGAKVKAHDPCVERWPERPDIYVHRKLERCLQGVDAIVFAVPHKQYQELDARSLLAMTLRPVAIVDASNIITDERAMALHRSGCRLLGVGKGHWRKRGYEFARLDQVRQTDHERK